MLLPWLRRRAGAVVRARQRERTWYAAGGTRVRYVVTPGRIARPLVLSLHHGWQSRRSAPRGIGRRQLEALVEPALRELDALIVAPDCPVGRWSDPANEEALLSLLGHLRARGEASSDPIVIVGVSDGAALAWSLLARHPAVVAGIVVVAGSPQIDSTQTIRGLPVYAIHSRVDSVMALAPMRAAIAMQHALGAAAELVVVDDLSHQGFVEYLEPLRGAQEWIRARWNAALTTPPG